MTLIYIYLIGAAITFVITTALAHAADKTDFPLIVSATLVWPFTILVIIGGVLGELLKGRER